MSYQPSDKAIGAAFELARERYAAFDVDVNAAMETLKTVPISLHCWQGDDVSGFEDPDRGLSGGIMATGNYPGKARTPEQLRADLDKAYSLIPGRHRLSLHASYLEADGKIPRDALRPEHFQNWVDWARQNDHGLDFNPHLCFRIPWLTIGFTLSHADSGIRQFWIDSLHRLSRGWRIFWRAARQAPASPISGSPMATRIIPPTAWRRVNA